MQRQADAAQNRRLRVLHASQGVRGLRTCGVLVPTVKKMTTLETTARASCDQKLIQLMRLRFAAPRQVQCSGPAGRVDLGALHSQGAPYSACLLFDGPFRLSSRGRRGLGRYLRAQPNGLALQAGSLAPLGPLSYTAGASRSARACPVHKAVCIQTWVLQLAEGRSHALALSPVCGREHCAAPSQPAPAAVTPQAARVLA